MPKFPVLSGARTIRILEYMGCWSRPGKGDHVTVKRKTAGGEIGATVPLHDPLDPGTLFGILRRLQIDRKDFLKNVDNVK
jgi:predicted RNA binding protein YcfA (HicA-like mRNA interferase family)